MTGHTPGPWMLLEDRLRSGDYLIGASPADAFARVPSANENSRANARLIAAAPDLLAALRILNHMGGDERGGYCICPRSDGSAPNEKHSTGCAMARAAISKAEGK